jgi:glycosyltransferase involved in cell wall biosynthesis
VSAVIPVYNGERYLAEALESVLAQTWRHLEVLVVDDGSTDGTAAVARGFGAPVVHHGREHAGLAATENAGMELAQGEFVAYLDADDLWLPGKLAVQTAALAADPGLDMVFGHVEQFVSPELATARPLPPDAIEMPGYSTGTMLIRRSSFARAGRFDPDLRMGEFVDWYIRAIERGLRSHMLPDVVMRRRIHGDNMGIRERKYRSDYVRILKAALDRRRVVAGAGQTPTRSALGLNSPPSIDDSRRAGERWDR